MSKKGDRPVWLGKDERRWDHFRVDVDVLHCTCMGVHEFAVYCALIAHAEVATGLARPSQKTLGAYFGLSTRRVWTAVNWLEENGWIKVDRSKGEPSVYFVLPPPKPVDNQVSTSERGADVDTLDLGTWCRGPMNVVQGTYEPRADELEPRTRTKNEHSSASGDPDAFERFWKIYPRRVDKRAALKSWRSALKRTTPDTIIAGAGTYATHVEGSDPKFVKYPATWLNADAWLNEYDDPNEEPGYVVH